MTPGVQIVLSGALSFGVPLVFAVKELVTLRRAGGGGGTPRHETAPPRPLPPDSGMRPLKPLPACLTDFPVVGREDAERPRVLEPT